SLRRVELHLHVPALSRQYCRPASVANRSNALESSRNPARSSLARSATVTAPSDPILVVCFVIGGTGCMDFNPSLPRGDAGSQIGCRNFGPEQSQGARLNNHPCKITPSPPQPSP